jgi:penicillin-binding protein 1A
MLADAINRGTGAGARTAGFRLPAAGKTGTTDSYADAWFVGYTPKLVAGVWIGRDHPAEIMRRGYAATVAVPAWASFMKEATRGDTPDWFRVPSTLERASVCQITGKRATEACRAAAANGDGAVYDDYFLRGSVPADECDWHGSEEYYRQLEAVATAGFDTDASDDDESVAGKWAKVP